MLLPPQLTPLPPHLPPTKKRKLKWCHKWLITTIECDKSHINVTCWYKYYITLIVGHTAYIVFQWLLEYFSKEIFQSLLTVIENSCNFFHNSRIFQSVSTKNVPAANSGQNIKCYSVIIVTLIFSPDFALSKWKCLSVKESKPNVCDFWLEFCAFFFFF